MQENPEMNERIRNNGTFRADSKQMRAMDGKQGSLEYTIYASPKLAQMWCLAGVLVA